MAKKALKKKKNHRELIPLYIAPHLILPSENGDMSIQPSFQSKTDTIQCFLGCRISHTLL